MSETVIGWHRIAWQMVRHLCGPHRALEHELAHRYDKARSRARAALRAARGEREGTER